MCLPRQSRSRARYTLRGKKGKEGGGKKEKRARFRTLNRQRKRLRHIYRLKPSKEAKKKKKKGEKIDKGFSTQQSRTASGTNSLSLSLLRKKGKKGGRSEEKCYPGPSSSSSLGGPHKASQGGGKKEKRKEGGRSPSERVLSPMTSKPFPPRTSFHILRSRRKEKRKEEKRNRQRSGWAGPTSSMRSLQDAQKPSDLKKRGREKKHRTPWLQLHCSLFPNFRSGGEKRRERRHQPRAVPL